MHYNWHRHYDPSLGRYTQPDPLGFVDGPSVYAYARSAPHRYVDKDGRNAAVAGCFTSPAGMLICGGAAAAAAIVYMCSAPNKKKRTRKERYWDWWNYPDDDDDDSCEGVYSAAVKVCREKYMSNGNFDKYANERCMKAAMDAYDACKAAGG